jgi:GTPase
MVVDGRAELAGPDLELVRLLRKTGRPLFLAVNKADSEKQGNIVDEFHRLGIKQMFPISAEHGRGIDDLLDAVLEILPAEEPTTGDAEHTEESKEESQPTDATAAEVEPVYETKVAIIGHPNVGKSTLLNCLTASDRAIVSPIPGTTRDAVDEIIEHNGRRFRFIDTAGIRRKGKTHLMAEKLSVVMARKHLEGADIALLVIDATEGVSQLDAAIAGYAHESGRSMIIVVNKWDLVISGALKAGRPSKAMRMRESKRPGDRDAYEERLRYDLKFLNYAPIVFISAQSGKGTEKIFPLLEQVAIERRKRILYVGDEPLHRNRGLRARLGAHALARENSIYDPGVGGAADVCALHQPCGEAALFLPAILGEPDPRGLWLSGDANLDQEPGEELISSDLCHR